MQVSDIKRIGVGTKLIFPGNKVWEVIKYGVNIILSKEWVASRIYQVSPRIIAIAWYENKNKYYINIRTSKRIRVWGS